MNLPGEGKQGAERDVNAEKKSPATESTEMC